MSKFPSSIDCVSNTSIIYVQEVIRPLWLHTKESSAVKLNLMTENSLVFCCEIKSYLCFNIYCLWHKLSWPWLSSHQVHLLRSVFKLFKLGRLDIITNNQQPITIPPAKPSQSLVLTLVNLKAPRSQLFQIFITEVAWSKIVPFKVVSFFLRVVTYLCLPCGLPSLVLVSLAAGFSSDPSPVSRFLKSKGDNR